MAIKCEMMQITLQTIVGMEVAEKARDQVEGVIEKIVKDF